MSHTVSVIICCHTEERLQDIREAVASVQRQSRLPEEIILIVDNNRSLCELLRKDALGGNVKVILHEGLRGSAAARNAGSLSATCDVVAFLDDDAVADSRWLDRLLVSLREGAVVVGGKAIPRWTTRRPQWFPEELNWLVGATYKGQPEARGRVRNPHMHNMAVLRSAFIEVGLLRTDVGGGGGVVGTTSRGGEEAELCLRIAQRFPSAPIVHDPEAQVLHKVSSQQATWPNVIRRSFGEGLYKAWMANVSHPETGSALSTEKRYLGDLLFRAIPSRLARCWQLAALKQVAAIVLCILAVGTGHLVGKWRFRNVSPVWDQPA